jgi:hypothetical protein
MFTLRSETYHEGYRLCIIFCSVCKIVLRTIGNLPRRTLTRALHRTFQIPYIYDYITKLCRKQAEVIQTHGNVNVRNISKNEAQHRKLVLKLVAVRHMIVQVSKLP